MTVGEIAGCALKHKGGDVPTRVGINAVAALGAARLRQAGSAAPLQAEKKAAG